MSLRRRPARGTERSCLIALDRRARYNGNAEELADLLNAGGWEVEVDYRSPWKASTSADVVVAVNAPTATRVGLLSRGVATVFYALEVDLPRPGRGRWSTLALPAIHFDGLIATSERRLALLRQYIQAGSGLVIENKFAYLPALSPTTTRAQAAVYVGAPISAARMEPFVQTFARLGISVDIISFGRQDRIPGVSSIRFVPGSRADLVQHLAAYAYGIVPAPEALGPSLLDFLYTPNKIFDYVAAGLTPVSNIEDPEPSVAALVTRLSDLATPNSISEPVPAEPWRAAFSVAERDRTLRFFDRLASGSKTSSWRSSLARTVIRNGL